MTTGTEMFNNLDARSKAISNALDELNEVITGGDFDRTKVYPAGDVTTATRTVDQYITDEVAPHFAALRVVEGVENAIDVLFEGLPGGDSILAASGEITKFMNSVNAEVQKLKDTANLGPRIQAFKDLNDPATTDRAAAPYGYVPALLNVINAAADTNLDSKPVTDALNKVEGVLTDIDSYTLFADYVARSTALLVRSLAFAAPGPDDNR